MANIIQLDVVSIDHLVKNIHKLGKTEIRGTKAELASFILVIGLDKIPADISFVQTPDMTAYTKEMAAKDIKELLNFGTPQMTLCPSKNQEFDGDEGNVWITNS